MNIYFPTNVKEVRRFLSMIQYYRDIHRIHIMPPLTELTELTGDSKTKKCVQTKVCDQAFETTKRLLMRDVMLTYPNFSKKFVIHTDASDYQLGAEIAQEGKHIEFFSR